MRMVNHSAAVPCNKMGDDVFIGISEVHMNDKLACSLLQEEVCCRVPFLEIFRCAFQRQSKTMKFMFEIQWCCVLALWHGSIKIGCSLLQLWWQECSHGVRQTCSFCKALVSTSIRLGILVENTSRSPDLCHGLCFVLTHLSALALPLSLGFLPLLLF